MNTKVAVIIDDYSQWGGVQTVVNHLFTTRIPFHIMVGLDKKNHTNKNPYHPKIKLSVINNEEELVQYLKKEQITHCIITSFQLEKVNSIINLLKYHHIKSIYYFHSTPLFWETLSQRNFSSFKKNYIRFISSIKKRLSIYNLSDRYKAFENIILNSDKFLLLSPHIIKETQQLLGKDYAKKLDYMYNIVSVNQEVEKKENIIISVARLTDYKRVFLSVKTLAPILKKHPDWLFYILGDGEEYDLIKNYLEEHQIKNIHLCGKVDNVHEYLAKSKICLLYSLFEGLPTILLEAGMLENTLVSYNSKGGVKDIIENGKNGFIVNNERELAKKIDFLIKNNDILEKMSKNNHTIFNKFDHSKILTKWEEILDIPKDSTNNNIVL